MEQKNLSVKYTTAIRRLVFPCCDYNNPLFRDHYFLTALDEIQILKIHVIVSFNDLIFDLPDCNVQFCASLSPDSSRRRYPSQHAANGDVMIRRKMRPRIIALKCRCKSEEFDAREISHVRSLR